MNLTSDVEYVMMCYNYRGWDEQTGPKATFDFLDELVENTKSLPGTVTFAIATGGFDWTAKEELPVGVTEKEAASLAGEFGVSPERDDESGALSFKYSDGKSHEMWLPKDALTNLQFF